MKPAGYLNYLETDYQVSSKGPLVFLSTVVIGGYTVCPRGFLPDLRAYSDIVIKIVYKPNCMTGI